MKIDKYQKRIPAGVQDYLPTITLNKRKAETKIRNLFDTWGYNEVQPPIFEYYENFLDEKSGMQPEKIYKLIDSEGKVLALRPDATLPIARMVSTRMDEAKKPLKLSYITNVYRNNSYSGYSKEITQAGIERIGIGSVYNDAEVIALMIETLKITGLNNFLVDIGQIDFFKGIVKELGFDEEEAEEIRKMINAKDSMSLEMYIEKQGLALEKRNILLSLPKFFGGTEIIEKARKITNEPMALTALDNLEKVCQILKEYEMDQYISIDLGMVPELNYYTGIFFKAMTKKIGSTISVGGRYDKLYDIYDNSNDAIGFAVMIDQILIAMERQNIQFYQIKNYDTLLAGDEKVLAKLYAKAKAYRDEGKKIEIFVGTEKDAKDYAVNMDIENIEYIGGGK